MDVRNTDKPAVNNAQKLYFYIDINNKSGKFGWIYRAQFFWRY